MNGVCLKHTDDCKPHCVTHDIMLSGDVPALGTVCTKGCNDVMKVLGNKVGDEQLFDIIICQAEKTINCKPFTGQDTAAIEDGSEGGGAPQKVCTSSKTVTPEAVCTDLDEAATSDVWAAGGSCVLDVLKKLQCDRDSSGQCLKTAAGSFMGCTVMDPSPFACGPQVFEYARQFLSCSCTSISQQLDSCPAQALPPTVGGFEPTATHTGACEVMAGTF